jgi:hypothetical protein
LGLENVISAFMVLAFGIIAGFVLFVCESCSKLTNLNFYLFEAYDRGDDELDGVDPEDVPRILEIKDSIIRDMEEQVVSLTLRVQEFERGKGRNGTRVRRRAGSFKTRDDPGR